jgi:hypothetical protein
VWETVLTFDEDIANTPSVTDGTPSFGFLNGALQTVNDCADADLKTFCFTYTPPAGIEAAVFWFFKVSAAEDVSGEVMADATYRFIADTAGPVLSFGSIIDNVSLPTITGDSTFGSAVVDITLTGPATRTYQTTASGGFWSYTLLPGDELPAGLYTVSAVGTDQYSNVGSAISTTLIAPEPPPPVDTTPPALVEVAPIGNTPDSTPIYSFTSTEAGTVLYGGSCSSGDIIAVAGVNTITFSELALGTYSDCTITVNDAANNTSALLAVTPFTVITPPPTLGSLLITVTSTGGDKTFSFTGDLGSFTVTTSGGLGQKEFVDVAAGAYSIAPAAASGWSVGANTCAAITVVAGEEAACAVSYAKNTVTSKKGHILGLLFNDKDNDGKLDQKGEISPLSSTGWRVYLDTNNNAIRDSGEPSTHTTLFGLYFFKDLTPGNYTVRIEPKSGKTITKPSSGFYSATVVAKHAVFAGLFGWH